VSFVFSYNSFILIPEVIRCLSFFTDGPYVIKLQDNIRPEWDIVTPDIMRWMQATVTFRVSKSFGSCWSEF